MTCRREEEEEEGRRICKPERESLASLSGQSKDDGWAQASQSVTGSGSGSGSPQRQCSLERT
jgi:hypothetical protein